MRARKKRKKKQEVKRKCDIGRTIVTYLFLMLSLHPNMHDPKSTYCELT